MVKCSSDKDYFLELINEKYNQGLRFVTVVELIDSDEFNQYVVKYAVFERFKHERKEW